MRGKTCGSCNFTRLQCKAAIQAREIMQLLAWAGKPAVAAIQALEIMQLLSLTGNLWWLQYKRRKTYGG